MDYFENYVSKLFEEAKNDLRNCLTISEYKTFQESEDVFKTGFEVGVKRCFTNLNKIGAFRK